MWTMIQEVLHSQDIIWQTCLESARSDGALAWRQSGTTVCFFSHSFPALLFHCAGALFGWSAVSSAGPFYPTARCPSFVASASFMLMLCAPLYCDQHHPSQDHQLSAAALTSKSQPVKSKQHISSVKPHVQFVTLLFVNKLNLLLCCCYSGHHTMSIPRAV